MHYLEVILWIIFIIIFIIFLLLFLLSIINSFRFKVPQVSTFKSDFKVMKKWLKKYNLEWKKIADLWSWTWKVLRFFEKEFNMKTTWYEIDLANILIAKVVNKIYWLNSIFYKKDYLKADLKKYDIIYIYLFPELIEKIENKIWNECNKWTIVISNAFKFKKHKPINVLKNKKWEEEVFLYKVNLQ